MQRRYSEYIRLAEIFPDCSRCGFAPCLEGKVLDSLIGKRVSNTFSDFQFLAFYLGRYASALAKYACKVGIEVEYHVVPYFRRAPAVLRSESGRLAVKATEYCPVRKRRVESPCPRRGAGWKGR